MKKTSLSVSKHHISGALFIIVIWVITTIAKWKYNGLILGFDYGAYQPDGAHYTYRTLTFLGNSPIHSAELVSSWYQNYSYKMKEINPLGLLPENNGAWGLVRTRILYPILSVPFVFIWGIPGMLVVPSLSLLALMLSPLILAKKVSQVVFACGLVFLVSASPTVSRWMLANLTDSLLVGLFSIYFSLFLNNTLAKRSRLIVDLIFIFLTAFTRFCFPFWMGLSIILFLRRNYSRASILLVGSLVSAVPSFLTGGESSILPAEKEAPLGYKLLLLPLNFLKISFFEVAQLAVIDRVLLALLVVALIMSVRTYRETTSQLFLVILLAGLFIGAINGTIGVNFRYQLPVLFPTIVLLMNALPKFFEGLLSSKNQ